jgi:DNA-directed RNA polymerase specialized sigma24 family protein
VQRVTRTIDERRNTTMNTIKMITNETAQNEATKTRSLTILADPKVVRAITVTLLHFGMKRQELEDGIAEVQMRTIDYLTDKPLPEGMEEWTALCATIAKNWRLNEKEKEKTQKKYDAGLCEEPDAHLPLPTEVRRDGVDAGRMLRVLEAQFEAGEMPPRGDEILDCVQAGMTSEEIGAELGLSAQTVRNRLLTIRKRFAKRLAMLGLAVVMMLLLLLGAGPGMIALQGEPTAPHVKVRELPPRPSPEAIAATLRLDAQRECDAHRWAECGAKLDEARGLDPSGEHTADVIALRTRVDAGMADEVVPLRAKP